MKVSLRAALAALPLIAFSVANVSAHALWVVPAEGGYKIHYGEPGESVLEKKEKLVGLGSMQIKDASGKTVKGAVQEDHVWVAAVQGGVSVSTPDAPLYGEGEHAGKPFWHARFVADVSQKILPTAGMALEILPDGKENLSFLVFKKGKPLADQGVTLFAPSGWNKTFKTDVSGKLRVEAPWPGLYVLEVGVEEKSAGKFKDRDYAQVYHAYTLSFMKP